MRTSLFLSTLFAVTLAGGAALAEKPHDAGQGKEPRVVQGLRAHGDIVDKTYGNSEKGSHASARTETVTGSSPGIKLVDRGASRISCSNTDMDCVKLKGPQRASNLEASPGETNRAARTPAFLDKVLGSDRMECNEGDMCSMSNRAVKRAWERAGGKRQGTESSRADAEGHAASLSQQKQRSRYDEQESTTRVVCNEGDQCMASSKETKKEWAYLAVKAGTWQGPEKQVSPAEVKIREYKAAESHTVPRSDAKAHGEAAAAPHDDAH